jgi:predicted DNA-binding transcriptional regulator AlpA
MPTRTVNPPSFVSLFQIAERVVASRKSIRRWLKDAGIAASHFGSGRNGTIRYPTAEVEAWIASRREKS